LVGAEDTVRKLPYWRDWAYTESRAAQLAEGPENLAICMLVTTQRMFQIYYEHHGRGYLLAQARMPQSNPAGYWYYVSMTICMSIYITRDAVTMTNMSARS
jgi:hypothetical protein